MYVSGLTALMGIALISLNGTLSIGIGDSLSLGFAVLFGVQIVLIGKFADAQTDIFAFSFFQFLAAAGLALMVCILRGEDMAIHGSEALIGVFYLIVPNTIFAFVAQNIVQRYTTDTMASLILSLESLFGFLCSVIYYHETPSLRFFVGAALCFAAILMNLTKGKRKVSDTQGGS